ncbi:hypothetical protein [Streptomyces sp. NPDC017202]|uniref:hypothetical protein n=1 Tax=Streptomyces sp. NPDC017202 TaxID=3364981 RepID=UPI0037B5D54E
MRFRAADRPKAVGCQVWPEPPGVRQGTEASAFGAFGYRLGMTMAEWACRSLMGLGGTWHIENSRP